MGLIPCSDMARRVYQLKRQYEGKKEMVISSSSRKKEIEREFSRLVRDYRSDRDALVEVVRLGYVKVTRYLSFGKTSFDTWICIAPAEKNGQDK